MFTSASTSSSGGASSPLFLLQTLHAQLLAHLHAAIQPSLWYTLTRIRRTDLKEPAVHVFGKQGQGQQNHQQIAGLHSETTRILGFKTSQQRYLKFSLRHILYEMRTFLIDVFNRNVIK